MNLHRVSSVVLSAVAALSLAASAQAAIVVPNPGFEADALADGGDTWPTAPTGWTAINNSSVGLSAVKNPFSGDSPQAIGDNFGYLYAENNGAAISLYQQVDTGFAANTTYTFQVLVGDLKKASNPAEFPFPDTVVLGIYNGTTNSGGALTDVLAVNSITGPGDGLAAYYTVNYTTGAVAPLGPVVIGMSVTNSQNSTNLKLATFDDVTVTVPEPASLGVLVGAAGLVALRRRRGQ